MLRYAFQPGACAGCSSIQMCWNIFHVTLASLLLSMESAEPPGVPRADNNGPVWPDRLPRGTSSRSEGCPGRAGCDARGCTAAGTLSPECRSGLGCGTIASNFASSVSARPISPLVKPFATMSSCSLRAASRPCVITLQDDEPAGYMYISCPTEMVPFSSQNIRQNMS